MVEDSLLRSNICLELAHKRSGELFLNSFSWLPSLAINVSETKYTSKDIYSPGLEITIRYIDNMKNKICFIPHCCISSVWQILKFDWSEIYLLLCSTWLDCIHSLRNNSVDHSFTNSSRLFPFCLQFIRSRQLR